MRADRYTLRTIGRRLAGRDDPWKHMARHARALSSARKHLDEIHQETIG
jgi:DNA primase